MSALPWVCQDHPRAQVRRSWDRTQYSMNGYPAGIPMDSNERFECAVCGRQLASEQPADPARDRAGGGE